MCDYTYDTLVATTAHCVSPKDQGNLPAHNPLKEHNLPYGDYMDVPVRASYKIMGNDDDGFLEDGIIGDYMDVPVRASYKIMGNDDDGFLEDGIIVKTKGSGYIDPRFKNRDTRDYRSSASQVIYGRPELLSLDETIGPHH
ncbi:unnamed protein product [Medioppia subpectinata]|uniref:Uncharacterized protein n=1 Tax=Medioppia subpectinata TaxID=1979941 RepID=A0A7R9L008_9ACAR|nr:unnamed protein product [Medioppia subpectinata]CAG2113083.1 unnamed protein product [Medioppia subpectinata]